MPLPHLKKDNNFENPDFETVDKEIAHQKYAQTHPFTPARDVKNPDDDGPDQDPSASDRS